MFQYMLRINQTGTVVRKWQGTPQIPGQINPWATKAIDIHPTRRRSFATTQMDLELTAISESSFNTAAEQGGLPSQGGHGPLLFQRVPNRRRKYRVSDACLKFH